jgi:hypothetical protein
MTEPSNVSLNNALLQIQGLILGKVFDNSTQVVLPVGKTRSTPLIAILQHAKCARTKQSTYCILRTTIAYAFARLTPFDVIAVSGGSLLRMNGRCSHA